MTNKQQPTTIQASAAVFEYLKEKMRYTQDEDRGLLRPLGQGRKQFHLFVH